MGWQERLKQSGDPQPDPSVRAGLTLEVFITSSAIENERGRKMYQVELSEFEEKLTPDQKLALRDLQPFLVARQLGDLAIIVSLSTEVANVEDPTWIGDQSPSTPVL